MTARWVKDPAEFAALAPAWDAALAASGSDNPFLWSDFVCTWCEAFVPAENLRILAVFEDGRLAAGLPLYLSRRRRRPILRVAGIGFANLTEPFFPPARAAAFARACGDALRHLAGWQYLNLPLVRSAWMCDPPGLLTRRSANLTAARLRIAQPAAATVATLSPRLQANLRRCQRLAAGELRLERETDSKALAAMIAFQLQHNGPDRYPPDTVVPAPREAWAQFTRRVLEAFAARDRLDAMALRLDGELAAVGFGFRAGPGYKSVLTAYHPRFRHWGPGLLFFYYLIEWCWRHQQPSLDMYGDAGDFNKRRWCNEFEPLDAVRFFPASPQGWLLRAGSRLWQR
ncbi:MAG TPA: GNAT family N-acetyltransferase [Terriglobales bacterium]|nr:GNAT family N-acetyltransferase [Terriglobales bacterium]